MNYSGISECDVLNGTGFRVVLFVSGCSHMCYNCQNPITWNKAFGHPYTEKTKEYILKCISEDYIDGITLSGGDPLYDENIDEILNLIKEIRRLYPEKTIWLYTGYEFNYLQKQFNEYKYTVFAPDTDKWLTRWEIVSNIDVLVDGEYIDSKRDVTLKWRGSSNQRVIDVKESLRQDKIVLYCD